MAMSFLLEQQKIARPPILSSLGENAVQYSAAFSSSEKNYNRFNLGKKLKESFGYSNVCIVKYISVHPVRKSSTF